VALNSTLIGTQNHIKLEAFELIESVIKMIWFTLLIVVPALVESKVLPVPKETFERCESDKGDYFNFDDFEMIAINDTSAILNGTVTVLKDMVGPIKAKAYCERYERGQWTMSALRKEVKDFCTEMNLGLEPWYDVFKDRDAKTCPFPAGSKFHFHEYLIDFSYVVIPPSYVGPWRLTLDAGERYCVRYHYDFFDF